MNENAKTVTVVGVAAALVLIAWWARPGLESSAKPKDEVGQKLVADFNPLTAASLEIIEFDEDTATVRPFLVAQATDKGKTRWSIPSHDNYPADAQDQVADAATSLLGLKILSVESSDPGEHAKFGVVDPGSKDLKVGDTGVGMRVTMKDKGGKVLLSLIIGKAVPDAKNNLRYVRAAGSDSVYVVAAKTEKLSAKFGDWIEKNLLKMNAWDLKQAWIRDYSVDALQGRLQQNADITLGYDDAADPKWKFVKDEKFTGDGKWQPRPLAADEELNTTKLDEMKSALDDLKIIDVRKKPPGLSGDLKAAKDFVKDREARDSLMSRGFIPAQIEQDGPVEIFSNEGEVRYLMKDGVEYVLRFGAVAADSGGAAKKDKKETTSAGPSRYLFVTTQFNPEAIAKPQPEPLPEEKKPAGADKAKPADAKPAEKGAKEADAKKPDAKDARKDDKKADLKAERERVEKENKRKKDEYDEKVKKGKEHVNELNARFADWYYVIADDVYKKIHLNRDLVVKKKEKKDKDKDADHAHDHEHDDHDAAKPADEKPNPLGDLDKLKKEGPASGAPEEKK
ncbi:MAG: DUF4340 domain-containing protein [Thermoguttaceae bacterium]|jgi:hypothetical protein